ncbi:MAG: PAS domain S-box protein [Bacteroidetes bacterium]|nr:PAS domain S-box protein [Bacteroidota bacterium]
MKAENISIKIQNNSASYDASSKLNIFSKIFGAIGKVYNYLSNRGIQNGQKISEVKRIKLNNRFAIFGLVACLSQLPIYIYLGLASSIVTIVIYNIVLSIVLILAYYSFHRYAKTIQIVNANLILFASSIYVGKESGVYLYFFAIIILPFILFDMREKLSIAGCMLFSFVLVFLLEYIDWTVIIDKTITPDVKGFIFASSLVGSFSTIIFCVYSLVKENSISEKLLEESETLFKGLLDATPDSTIITDTNGIITLYNKQVEATFGYTTNELLGKNINTLFPERFQNKTNGKEISPDLFLTKKDATEVAVDISQNSYVAKSGTMLILVIRDITERKKHEQELLQFSYIVSHDLKAPLRAIFKLSEWIEEDFGANTSASLKKNLQLLKGRAFRLEALINGLLEYSKIGRTNTKKETVNTHDMLKGVIEMLAPPSNFIIDIKPGMPVFETKKIPLEQIFFNLLSNAIKYNDKETATITIMAESDNKFYKFSVEDNGMGIDPIYHEKVFVIFQTLEGRDKIEGTGIGLAIIKKSVEDMGGTITLRSEHKGSKFTFTWPK